MKKLLMVFVSISIATLFVANPVYAQDSSATYSELNFENIEVSLNQAVLVIRINNPPRNAVSKTTLTELNTGLDIALSDDSIGAVVITGTEQVFSEGAGGESAAGTANGEESHAVIANAVYRRIEGFPKPVIAAIAGISAGGGNELALACDIRIAAESALFRQHELQAGLIPGFGGMQRLQRHVGLGRAKEMMLTGRFIDATEAFTIGLVTSVVPDSDLLVTAINLAQQLNDNLDKHALIEFKSRLSLSYDESFSEALRNDQIAFDRIAISEEARAALIRFIDRQQE